MVLDAMGGVHFGACSSSVEWRAFVAPPRVGLSRISPQHLRLSLKSVSFWEVASNVADAAKCTTGSYLQKVNSAATTFPHPKEYGWLPPKTTFAKIVKLCSVVCLKQDEQRHRKSSRKQAVALSARNTSFRMKE